MEEDGGLVGQNKFISERSIQMLRWNIRKDLLKRNEPLVGGMIRPKDFYVLTGDIVKMKKYFYKSPPNFNDFPVYLERLENNSLGHCIIDIR